MANKKKDVYKARPLTEKKKNIISVLIDEYDIETSDDIQEALRDLLEDTVDPKWMTISGMRIMSEAIMMAIAIGQSQSESASITADLRPMCRRTGTAACMREVLRPGRYLTGSKRSTDLNVAKDSFQMSQISSFRIYTTTAKTRVVAVTAHAVTHLAEARHYQDLHRRRPLRPRPVFFGNYLSESRVEHIGGLQTDRFLSFTMDV